MTMSFLTWCLPPENPLRKNGVPVDHTDTNQLLL
jgi:hypothetical protein